MKKILFVATVTTHINTFHIPYLKLFKEQGYEVHVASNGKEKIDYCDKHFNLPFERFPIKKNNLKAYKQLKKIVDENEYEIIHCHTPVGGVLTRLSAKDARKKGTKVIYTAHGFHFYKGAPSINWIIYYPIEKYLSKYTDTLITINSEDYDRARKKFKKCKRIELIKGVGIDNNQFGKINLTEDEKAELKNSLNIKEKDFVIIYPAELSDRKNQCMLIKAISLINENKRKNIKVLLPGKDSKNGKFQELAKLLGLQDMILFLGYRSDINKLMQISNLAISTSKQEGLPVNIIEAMFMKLPIIATDCRGNRDLISSEHIVKIGDFLELSRKIQSCISKKECENIEYKDIDKYSIDNIKREMIKIYKGVIKDGNLQ